MLAYVCAHTLAADGGGCRRSHEVHELAIISESSVYVNIDAPALTRLLGATWAGRTARELNDRAFRMYCMCMADPRRRFRRLQVDDDDVLANPPGGLSFVGDPSLLLHVH
jgi:hypothetical protein